MWVKYHEYIQYSELEILVCISNFRKSTMNFMLQLTIRISLNIELAANMLRTTSSSEGAVPVPPSRTGSLVAHPCLTMPAITPEGMAYIRRRNERERERVRCVNDHYDCLRRFIPSHFLQAAYGDSRPSDERGVCTAGHCTSTKLLSQLYLFLWLRKAIYRYWIVYCTVLFGASLLQLLFDRYLGSYQI